MAWALVIQNRFLKLAVGTWNIIFSLEKEPELEQGVEIYRLDKVRLPSLYSSGSGINLLLRGRLFSLVDVFSV